MRKTRITHTKAQVDSFIGNLDINRPLNTSITRLKELDVKLGKQPKETLNRWCEAQFCGCLGCANMMGWKDKSEWQDYTDWLAAEKPERTEDVYRILMDIKFKKLTEMPVNNITLAINI